MTRPTPRLVHPEPRWHRRKEDRPTEILTAALHEFTSRGFAAARLEDIARGAGCTKGTIFLYFENKEELFKAVIRHNVIPFIQQAESMVEQHEGTPAQLLERLMRARWATLVNSPVSALPKMIFAEAGNFPDLARFYYDEVIARSQAVMARVLRDGVARGAFREMDVEHVASTAAAPLIVAAMWKHSFQVHTGRAIDPDRYFEAALDVLLAGVARPAEGGSRA